MPLYRDAAVVLRTHQLGEADRIVTMFSRGRGKVRAVAKGVRRTKSKFGARLEPAMVVDVQCFEGRNLDTVTQAESLASYGDQIARSYAAWTASNAVLETCERLTEEGEPQRRQFMLVTGALAALAAGEIDSGLVLDSYLLRAMAVAGWAAACSECAVCGATGQHRAFAVGAGGAVCRQCRRPGAVAVRPETLPFMIALSRGDWARAEQAERPVRSEAAGLIAAHLQWHTERGVRSLRLVEREV